ncbi:hypothetical protein AQPE_1050 [Aquipluma nitroreducens]|uniref:Glycosyltransferase RgtA/B/C/D-like domain-containing protein n=1 Tax=Aquipluma nitroreducens TaxID=2010828 RepID=A0A5K7S5U1_9BACT|nr:hypothetical protein [Aquipluma nitroreducens]BBE16903.1 hypothetical protein AQPE_1050 [Aquipluma nitroreducens]
MKKIDNRVAYIILFFCALFFVLFSVYSKGNWGGADSYSHYRISRYAFKYPHLFLDLWGKPVFNILSSPFSQFGFLGIKIFNAGVALLSAFIAYDIARIYKWHASYMAILMLLFAPIYFIIIPSGLTEPLFGLVLISAVWFFIKDRFIFSAMIISLLPFARNEGFVILPLFLTAYLLKKEYRAIPFLGFGFFFFSLIGWAVFHDFFWIFPQSQGGGDQGIYGTDSLFHFVYSIDNILGIPILIFWLVGFVFSTYAILKNFRKVNNEHYFYLLVVGGFLVYFAAHSVVRWLWEGRSLGLIRVIAGVVPLAALLSMRGMHEVLKKFEHNRRRSLVFIFVFGIIISSYPFFKYPVPIPPGGEEKLIRVTSEWLKEKDLDKQRIFYFDPYLVHLLNFDPYDQSLSFQGVADKLQPSNSMNIGNLLVWDAHFGPNEGGVQLDNLMDDLHLQLIKTILPSENFKVLGGYDYGIYIFRKVEQKIIQEKKQVLFRELAFGDSRDEHVIMIDGKKVLKMDSQLEFSPSIQVPVAEIQAQDFLEISASARILLQEPLELGIGLLVLSVEADQKSVSYNKVVLAAKPSDIQNWQETSFTLRLNANFPEGAILSLYVWNNGKKNLLLENLKLTISGF